MPKFVLTIETETEAEALYLAKLIDEEILMSAEDYYYASFAFFDFVGKPGEFNNV